MKILHNEVNLIIQCIIVQDQDGQNIIIIGFPLFLFPLGVTYRTFFYYFIILHSYLMSSSSQNRHFNYFYYIYIINIGLAVNAGKNNVEVGCDRGMKANEHITVGNNSYEKVKTFKYLGSLLKNQNYIYRQIKCGLEAGNLCY